MKLLTPFGSKPIGKPCNLSTSYIENDSYADSTVQEHTVQEHKRKERKMQNCEKGCIFNFFSFLFLSPSKCLLKHGFFYQGFRRNKGFKVGKEQKRRQKRKEKKKKVPREAGEEEMMMKKKTERKEGRGDSLASKNTDGIRRMINYW